MELAYSPSQENSQALKITFIFVEYLVIFALIKTRIFKLGAATNSIQIIIQFYIRLATDNRTWFMVVCGVVFVGVT